MTADPHDDLPIGRKIRVAGDCPTLCATSPSDHVEHGDKTHFSAEQVDPTGSLGLFVRTSDDGATWGVSAGLMGDRCDWDWTFEQAQRFVEQLQTLLASTPGLLARPDPLPTARETVALALLQRADPHPATPAGRALEILAGVREPEDVASVDILSEIQTLQALIEQGKHEMDRESESGRDTDTDDQPTAESKLAFRSLVHLEQQRRELMARLLETPA